MPDQAKPLDVCADTCVLINLAHASRLALLGQIQDMIFHAPREVLNEVTEPEQKRRVEAALENILLKAIQQGSLTVQAADLIKAELETNRFKMSFKSFQDLV
jgi:predicted nucleic acid-binding protein